MKNIRERFNNNAEEFDELMVEMLEENEKLKIDASRYHWLRTHIGQMVLITNSDYTSNLVESNRVVVDLKLDDSLADINTESFDGSVDKAINKES